VKRHVRDAGVAGSNPATPTILLGAFCPFSRGLSRSARPRRPLDAVALRFIEPASPYAPRQLACVWRPMPSFRSSGGGLSEFAKFLSDRVHVLHFMT